MTGECSTHGRSVYVSVGTPKETDYCKGLVVVGVIIL
jgi:hypothetical protein